MKNKINKFIQSKIPKRIVSVITAFVLMLGILPVCEIYEETKDLNLSSIFASAEDLTMADDPEFIHDAEYKITVKNSQFAEYSRSCQTYPKYHQNDIIKIADVDDSSACEALNFNGLGTEDYPFSGSISIDSNTDITLNLDAPLFNYVYDTVTISNSGKPLKLSRYYYRESTGSKTTPILAQNVLPGNGDKAEWNISISKPTYESTAYLQGFGGLIGRMKNDAQLTVNVTMNADGDDSSAIALSGAADIGLVCGYIEQNARLTASFSSNRGEGYGVGRISTTSGNAGGLVGTMESGAVFEFTGNQCQSDGSEINTSNGYAGGIVGSNNGGSVTLYLTDDVTQYTIAQHIEGTLGSGSIYGYYKPTADNSFDVELYNITNNCQVNGSGSVGGLFGVLENDYNMVISGGDTTLYAVHSSGSADNVGGLIGKYSCSALEKSLTIENITVCPTKGTSDFYGGGIALIEDTVTTGEGQSALTTIKPAYVKFDNFTVSQAQGANGMTFGGLVAKGDNSFIEANNTTISVNGNFKGGAAVGSLENGVLKLSEKFDISGANPNGSPSDAYREGKIVGYRDNGLVYADSWTFTGNSATVDNIGSWGDIIVFDGEKLNKLDVLTENADHTITLFVPESTITISNVADYAKTSLAFQIDASKNKVLTNTNAAKTDGDITFGNAVTIDLTGTGLRGITRDNAEADSTTAEKCGYSGTVTGNDSVIILDIENIGGLPVYRHKYNGMFAFANGVTVKNLKFGTASKKGKIDLSASAKMYAGSLASEATESFTVSNVEVNTAIKVAGGSEVYVGGLLGNAASSIEDINVLSSTFKCDITDNNTHSHNGNASGTKYSCFGGVIGRINHSKNEERSWTFKDITVSGKIESKQGNPNKIGGLIAVIDQHTGVTSRSLNLTNVNVNGLTLSGTGTTMGGLLGYSWLNVNTTFHNVTATGSNKITDSAENAKLAGLVYQGTGHWVVEKDTNGNPGIKIDGLTVDASKAESFGMIVNQGKTNDTAIFLEIKEGAYVISSSNFDNLKSGCVFDEIVAYSANGDINANGQGVVSINVGGSGGGLTMDGTNGSNTYNAQTERGKIANKNTRYYYNLDTIRTKESPSDAEKLMLWALSRYAHSSINTYFTNSFSGNVIPANNYDMRGYSWYPVDVNDTVTVNGTFIFYNSEFEKSEAAKTDTNKFFRTSLGAEKADYTQHHLMQNGLFRDVTGTLNIGNVTLQGSVGTDDYGSGALVWGTVKGSSASNIATVKMADDGSISLDGVFVHDLADYNPLLINKIDSYSTVSIGNVSNTAKYKTVEGINNTGGYPEAATSLIGQVGKADATNINIGFNSIKLDGRTDAHAHSYDLDDVYNTDCSLFTRATLLESFMYDSGSSGIYNYTYAEDWGEAAETAPRNVTYGSEISDNTTRNQYYGEEFWYYNENHESGKYTIYKSDLTPNSGNAESYSLDFSGFIPYVYDASTKANVGSEKKYQLSVNHEIPKLSGCGTYNDPYQIYTGDDLENIARLINGETGYSIRLPNLNESNSSTDSAALYTKKWDNYGDTEYTWDGSSSRFKPETGNSRYTQEQVRTYLAGAYYKLNSDITLSAVDGNTGFIGLGNTNNEYAAFRGVIVGGGHTITNKSQNPLIFASYGSVVKDVVINVDTDITIANVISAPTFSYNSGTAYGSVMGKVLGGDNIIDKVTVNFSENKIILRKSGANNTNKLIPIGGYVGAAVKGCLIFRNMRDLPESDRKGLKADTVVDYNNTQSIYNEKLSDSDTIEWLYVNPIVGRVINCAVFTESDAYRPFEDGTRKYYDENGNEQTYEWAEGAVTMRNGTKNYSIADITDTLPIFETTKPQLTGKKDTTSNDSFRLYSQTTLTFPNAQSLFIASLVTQCGLSTGQYPARSPQQNKQDGGFYEIDNWGTLSYYGYRSTHIANYDMVGNYDSSKSDEPTSGEEYEDYLKSKTDLSTRFRGDRVDDRAELAERTETIPYIIGKYTPKIVDEENPDTNYGYIALCMTHQYSYLNMVFSGAETTYYMPDGFRGIGMIGYKNFQNAYSDEVYQDMIAHIFGVSGNSNVISLNMSLLNYSRTDSYLPSSSILGFGFFDSVMMNKGDASDNIDPNTDEYSIHDFTLTGKVRYDIVDITTGKIPPYNENHGGTNNNDNMKNYLSVGGLIGTVAWRSGKKDKFKTALTAVTPSNLEVSGVTCTGGLIGYNISENDESSITTISRIVPKKLTVQSGVYAGGLIGYSTNTALDIQDVTIEEPNIISNYAASGLYYRNAVGGIVGYVDTDTKNNGVKLKNITIGKIDAFESMSFGYKSQTGKEVTIVGGLIGKNNTKSTNRLNDNTITHSTIIEDCNIYNVNLYGHRVGGVIGSSENNSSTTSVAIYNTHVISTLGSTIKGVSNTSNNGRGCAGFIGYFRTSKDNNVIDGCSLEGYDLRSAIEAGAVSGSSEGGTINIRNFKVSDTNFHTTKTVGGLYGWNKTSILGYNILMNNVLFNNYDNDEVPTDTCGYLCGNFNDSSKRVKIAGFSRKGTINREKMIGNKSNDYDYGTDGYIIFADYEGKCLTDEKSKIFSDINSGKNVTDYKGEDVTNNAPYVTSSPKRTIGTDQFLTGDGVSAVLYNNTVFRKIVYDRKANVKGAYVTSNVITPEDETAIMTNFSRALDEFDDSTGVVEDFPLLVISDTDPKATTELINNYLTTLTNTTYNFAEFADSSEDNSIANVELNTCVFNKETGKFKINTGTANLYHSTIGSGIHCFRMDANSVDNGHDYAQFTLIDVQFKDPADTDKVAYHLYVPVIVKKLLQFEFKASIESGTSYYPDAYKTKKTLFENLGNPVTIRFEYKYDRDEAKWIEAINGGENLMGNLYKSLFVDYAECTWPADTRFVLVDASNKDKAYYLDNPINENELKLSSFKDEEGNSYAPVPFSDLMKITIVQDNENGTLMLNNNESGENIADGATVKDSDGKYYRFINDDENPTEKYKASDVTEINPERYYLSIFTMKNDSDNNIYHIQVSSMDKFTEEEGQIGWRPNKVLSSLKNDTVHLISGMLYDTTFTLTATSANGSQLMKKDNNRLEVKMQSTISLTHNAIDKQVDSNMQSAGTSTIYQTFLMTYDTVKTKGESSVIGLNENAYPYTTVNSYKIYKGKTVDEDKLYRNVLSGSESYKPTISGTNYIDLWNKVNLIDILREEANEYSVTLSTDFWIGYESDTLGYQFPKKNTGEADVEIGAKVIGYSNISSALASLNYSESTWRIEGDKRYYTEDDNSATLTYNADTTPSNSAGSYSTLGINAVELGDDISHIDSTAVYDTSELKSSGEYVEFKISLSRRKDGYQNKLVIDKYFKNLEIRGNSDEPLLKLENGTLALTDDSNIKVTNNADGTEYTVRVKKSLLPTLGQDKIYTVKIAYDVYTGNSKFNNDGFSYSNYMVTLTAALYDSMNSESYSPSSSASDHIIYTNARLQSNVMLG